MFSDGLTIEAQAAAAWGPPIILKTETKQDESTRKNTIKGQEKGQDIKLPKRLKRNKLKDAGKYLATLPKMTHFLRLLLGIQTGTTKSKAWNMPLQQQQQLAEDL